MSVKKLELLSVAWMLLAIPSFAQRGVGSSSCMVEYENHNQINYGPLVVQDVKGTVIDAGLVALPKVCVGLFTETDHKLVVVTESDPDGKFSLQSVPPGKYRLIVKADPLCVANVPLRIAKSLRKKRVLRVHMKPRGLDSCSYADLEAESVSANVSPPRGSALRRHSASMPIHGTIVAFRPSDRLFQAVSEVINSEIFLFRLNERGDRIVKIIYSHEGYSEIKGAAAKRSAELILQVQRDHNCDGDYGQFISEATEIAAKDKAGSIPVIRTLGSFHGLPPSYALECFRLDGPGNIRMP